MLVIDVTPVARTLAPTAAISPSTSPSARGSAASGRAARSKRAAELERRHQRGVGERLEDPADERGRGDTAEARLLEEGGGDVAGRGAVARRPSRRRRRCRPGPPTWAVPVLPATIQPGKPAKRAGRRALAERGDAGEAVASNAARHAGSNGDLADDPRLEGADDHVGARLARPRGRCSAREQRAAVGERGVGVGELERRDEHLALADGDVDVVAGLPHAIGEGLGVVLVALGVLLGRHHPARLLVRAAARRVSAPSPNSSARVLDAGRRTGRGRTRSGRRCRRSRCRSTP